MRAEIREFHRQCLLMQGLILAGDVTREELDYIEGSLGVVQAETEVRLRGDQVTDRCEMSVALLGTEIRCLKRAGHAGGCI